MSDKKANKTNTLKAIMENITTIHGTLNVNCKVSDVPFPAVSICNFNIISLKATKRIEQLLLKNNRSQSEINSFFSDLAYLTNYDIDSTRVGHYKEIMDILKYHYFTVNTIMEELHQKCENLAVYCMFNTIEKNCSDMFSLVKTVDGYCCGFNYGMPNDGSKDNLLQSGDNIEYFEEQSDDKSTNLRILATPKAGRTSGIYVVFNLEPEDYPSWAYVPYVGANIILSDPSDFPETTILSKFVSSGESLDFNLEPLIFQIDPRIRDVQVSKRNCLFHDELHLENSNKYSFETCSTECRVHTLLKYCGCVPYKYPKKASQRACEFEDLACLINVTTHVSVNPMSCNPQCFVECNDKLYTMKSKSVPFVPEMVPENIIAGHNVSQLTSLRVYYGRPICNCYKLVYLIDTNYIIATFGGVFSLSFGGSILTLIELAYLLISALLILLLRICRKYFGNIN
ncbi:pickpocket protein 28-like [Galleria mellonella]|uniref:Pickpocket protein 28-like n=1 Tax=Galleria mellonella TaxID=7137 RepID=A0ABM3MGH8_GALME|nr:pickpocket protein 28-like [Galleria mellonella]